jgi:hypothetical protein
MEMVMAQRDRPPIVVGDSTETGRFRLLDVHTEQNAARVLWAAGLLYLIGSLADVILAWFVNADPGNPNSEFITLSSTVEGTPRIVLAVALIWVALHIRGSASLITQRFFGLILILLGIGGAIVGAMMVSDYFVIRGQVLPEEQTVFASIVLKTLTLSALHLVLLVPVGVLAVRRPGG